MKENVLTGLAGIIVLGVASQWLAWRLKIPSILLLLLLGFIVGPVFGFIDPDAIFGNLLFPIVSISVALILFEGGLSLKVSELKKTGSTVQKLISIGALITWVLSSISAIYVLGMDLPISVLFGAIVIVSGPTVIMPLLRHIKPTDSVASVLRWEGILIDPIGAILSVLVYEAILAERFGEMTSFAFIVIMETVFVGCLVGAVCAIILVIFLRRYWIPDFLQNPVTLMAVVTAFTISNTLQAESGLLSVTVMGIVLANQKNVNVKHIIEFKENLRVLLISLLFIILAARLDISALKYLSFSSMVFLGILILIVRPLSVITSTFGSKLSLKERLFISFLYPRGIVAAAVSSVFALRLIEAGYHEAHNLIPLTFFVIVGTVVVYGIGAPLAARWLRVAHPNPQGLLIVGAQSWAVTIAKALKGEGFRVILVDTNWYNIRTARMAEIDTFYGSILSEEIMKELNLDGIGRLLAMTSNDGVNSLTAINFAKVFGSSQVYQLVPQSGEKGEKDLPSHHLRGRFLFGKDLNYTALSIRFAKGALIKKTGITEEFTYEDFLSVYGKDAVPLFLIDSGRNITVFTSDESPVPKAGNTLLSLVDKDIQENVKMLKAKKGEGEKLL